MSGREMTPAPALSAIVVSYNTRDLTLQCLDALYAQLDAANSEVWVVDNASSDGSADAIRSRFPQTNLIANDGNLGFAAANNLAMKRATGNLLLLLNSDAFVRNGAIDGMVEYLDSHPDVQAIGPQLLNDDGSVQASVFQYPTPFLTLANNTGLNALRHRLQRKGGQSHPPSTEARYLKKEYLSGACLLVRREVYETIGGFDERFFFYGEDCDWQMRMQQSNFKIAFLPSCQVLHLQGASGSSNRLEYTILYHQSNEIFILKHFGLVAVAAHRMAVMVGCAIDIPRCLWRRVKFWQRQSHGIGLQLNLHLVLMALNPKPLIEQLFHSC